MMLSELASKYTGDIRYLSTGRSKDTYDHCLAQFIGWLTVTMKLENSIRQFTPANVNGFVEYLQQQGLKATTINLRLAALSGMAKYGMQRETRPGKYLLNENPVDRIKRPKNKKPPERYLVLDELRLVLNAPDTPVNEQLVLLAFADQPLRASEWAGLSVRDARLVDDNRIAISVRVKGGNYKTKVLGERFSRALDADLKVREPRPDDPLLVNSVGKRYTRQTISEVVHRAAKRAGVTRVPVRAHLIRHTIASAAGADGASDHAIAAMLGHSGTQTVKRYVHGVRPDEALERIRGVLG